MITIISTVAIGTAIYVVINHKHVANEPCNGEVETLNEISKMLDKQTQS